MLSFSLSFTKSAGTRKWIVVDITTAKLVRYNILIIIPKLLESNSKTFLSKTNSNKNESSTKIILTLNSVGIFLSLFLIIYVIS